MLLNANTLTFEMKEMKSQRKLFLAIDEMKNILDHLRKKLEQQKQHSCNRISQLDACLTISLDEFEQFFHNAFSAYTNKERIGMLKKRDLNAKRRKQSKTRYE